MSKQTYDAAILGRRILRLTQEHGTPNTYAPSEVFPASPMWLGRFMRDPICLSYLNRGLAFHGIAVTYSDRRIAVADLKELSSRT